MSPISSTLANASAYGYRNLSAAAAGGTFESIASATGTGSSGTITFSSIPSTYASLQIRIIGRTDAAVNTTYVQVQYNATAMTKGHYVRSSGTAASANQVDVPFYIAGGSTTADIMGVGIIDIHDYASTTRNKTGRSFGGWNGNDVYTSNERVQIASFFLNNTSAISALSLVLGNGNWTTNSTVSLYGIKGA